MRISGAYEHAAVLSKSALGQPDGRDSKEDYKPCVEAKSEEVPRDILAPPTIVNGAVEQIHRCHLDGRYEVGVDKEDAKADFGDVVEPMPENVMMPLQLPGNDQRKRRLHRHVPVWG